MDHFYCSTPLFCHREELVEKDYVRIRCHMTDGISSGRRRRGRTQSGGGGPGGLQQGVAPPLVWAWKKGGEGRWVQMEVCGFDDQTLQGLPTDSLSSPCEVGGGHLGGWDPVCFMRSTSRPLLPRT